VQIIIIIVLLVYNSSRAAAVSVVPRAPARDGTLTFSKRLYYRRSVMYITAAFIYDNIDYNK